MAVSGEIDQLDVHRLWEDLVEHSRDHAVDLTVDLSDVHLLSSVAIRARPSAATNARRDGADVRLLAPRDCIAARVLAVCGIPHEAH